MSRTKYTVLAQILLLALLCLATTRALPTCADDDEDCRDRHMHPDLPARAATRKIAGENTNEFWLQQSRDFVWRKISATPNTKQAKNIIMFLGDGLGLTTIASARNVLGGEEKSLEFEKFPHTGLSKTYSVDAIVPDSACTATAYLCGVKAQSGTIGLTGAVDRGDCQTMLNVSNHVYSIAKSAMEAGKSAGVVTTTRITHASPAGVYAHIAERDWENNAEVEESCGKNSNVQDIAYQLIHGEVGSKLKLMLGGGRAHFMDKIHYANGLRTDAHNLIEDYQKQSSKNKYITNLQELNALDLNDADRVLGLFQDSHLLYHLETDEQSNQPTLEQMTRKAIEYLSKNEQGYFIFIEGGRIDLAHHDNMARVALDETAEFSKAIAAAYELTSNEDTLIVVTADHSHAFSYSGYPYRGSDIFGKAPATPDDQKPYLTLSYANGPSYARFYDKQQMERTDPTKVLTGDVHDQFPAAVPLDSETHGGEDVPVYATGPWSHLFTGVYEQNAIPHMMAYASCLGNGLTVCKTRNS